ncbi:MAG: hypothetical protein PHU44_19015 [Syntrophales bacterium]|nr:hypothetical protein [Syntrophales bacterium]MDD5642409.1 hypothetical protein [Syntrophales bacterium]
MKLVRLIFVPLLFICLLYPTSVFAGKSGCKKSCVSFRVAGFVRYCGGIPDSCARVGVAGPGLVKNTKANFIGFFVIKNQLICCPKKAVFYTWEGSVFARSTLFKGATAYDKLSFIIACCKPTPQSLYVTLRTR